MPGRFFREQPRSRVPIISGAIRAPAEGVHGKKSKQLSHFQKFALEHTPKGSVVIRRAGPRVEAVFYGAQGEADKSLSHDLGEHSEQRFAELLSWAKSHPDTQIANESKTSALILKSELKAYADKLKEFLQKHKLQNPELRVSGKQVSVGSLKDGKTIFVAEPKKISPKTLHDAFKQILTKAKR